MKQALMYGAGNIGRGFIGMLFSASGYETVFVDVSAPLVDELNVRRSYPVRILEGNLFMDVPVTNVRGVNGTNLAVAARAVAECDLMATAVGVRVLPRIAPAIAEGIRLRRLADGKPLNILICENLMDADRALDGMLRQYLSAEDLPWYEENVGLVETSIGRMVPVQTDELRAGDPLRVCVEKYGFLPVNKDGFKGEIPSVKGMMPVSPFDFYVKRKLYLHNMAHAVCAYFGDYLGLEYISDSIDDKNVYIVVKNAMLESAVALSRRYGVPLDSLLEHVDDLLYRFTNSALKDTCKRVGADAKRKLSPEDRLIGALTLVRETGGCPSYIGVGVACALLRYFSEENIPFSEAAAARILQEHCHLPKDVLSGWILSQACYLAGGGSMDRIRQTAEGYKATLRPDRV